MSCCWRRGDPAAYIALTKCRHRQRRLESRSSPLGLIRRMASAKQLLYNRVLQRTLSNCRHGGRRPCTSNLGRQRMETVALDSPQSQFRIGCST